VRFYLAILIVLVLLTGGVGIFLATWDIPAPSSRVEKTIPDDKLGR
jgi:hypothetical protein